MPWKDALVTRLVAEASGCVDEKCSPDAAKQGFRKLIRLGRIHAREHPDERAVPPESGLHWIEARHATSVELNLLALKCLSGYADPHAFPAYASSVDEQAPK